MKLPIVALQYHGHIAGRKRGASYFTYRSEASLNVGITTTNYQDSLWDPLLAHYHLPELTPISITQLIPTPNTKQFSELFFNSFSRY